VDLDGNTRKDALSAPQDKDNGVNPDRRFFGVVLPRTAKDYQLEAALDAIRADWERTLAKKQEFLQPTES
jgi:hypothetical protein